MMLRSAGSQATHTLFKDAEGKGDGRTAETTGTDTHSQTDKTVEINTHSLEPAQDKWP